MAAVQGMQAPKHTFQDNVRAGNDMTKVAKASSVLAVAITFLVSLSIGRAGDASLAYALFLMGGVLAVSLHPRFQSIRDNPALKLQSLPRPILQSLGLGLLAMFIFVIAFRWPDSGGTFGERFASVFLFAVVGAFVEESIRWMWLQTMPYPVFTANALWVLLHPQVNRVFKGEAPDLVFVVFAFAFGLIMTAIMWYYETPMGANFNLGLGPMAAVTFHGVFNTMAVLFTVVVGGIRFDAFAWPTATLIAGVAATALVLCRRRARRFTHKEAVPNAQVA